MDAEVVFTDPNGDSVTLYNYHGTLIAPRTGMGERMRRLPEFKARDDDVFICGYPKSGTHWVWDIVKMILSGSTEAIPYLKTDAMLESRDLNHFEEMSAPRVLNNHLHLEDLPPDFLKRKCKIVYLLRNPKDVLCSQYYHVHGISRLFRYNGQWNGFFHLWLRGEVEYGSWFTYVKRWEKSIQANPHIPVYTVYYEDLKTSFIPEVKKLASFLGVTRNEEFFRDLKAATSFTKMQAEKAMVYSERSKTVWRKNIPQMYRKGIIGDWKNHLTVAQNEQINAIIEEELKDSNLKFCYEG